MWNIIIRVPWRRQKYGLQKFEKTWKSKKDVSTYVVWLASRRSWAGNGSENAKASPRLALHWPTPGLSFISKGRGLQPQTSEFHPLHHFYHLETKKTILIQKHFPISSAALQGGLLSHGHNFRWPSRSYCDSFSFCSQWPLLAITALFKCLNIAPSPTQCPLHEDLWGLSYYILSLAQGAKEQRIPLHATHTDTNNC